MIKFVEKTIEKDHDFVLSVDIRKCFDEIPHQGLKKIIRGWSVPYDFKNWALKSIKAPILDNNVLTAPRSGAPQGGFPSPLLCNEYVKK